MRDFAIRQATIVDIEKLAPLFDGYRQFYGKSSDLALARAFISERMKHNESVLFLALDHDGRALGFTQLYPSFSSVSARRIYVLNDLFVIPQSRSRGVAKSLLAASAAFGRQENAAYLTLSTAVDNHAAQALYEAQGWVRDSTYLTYELTL